MGSVRSEGGNALAYSEMIPLSEKHLRALLREWVRHYNAGRPHKTLGPGIPGPPVAVWDAPRSGSRHRLPVGTIVRAKPVLGGLHHEYSFMPYFA